MLCGNCRKNQATKTYEKVRGGKKAVSYLCLDCYHKLCIDMNGQSETDSFSECPYCGTTSEEVKKRNIVGCAKCYEMLKGPLYPVVMKMQGGEIHKGKRPLGGASEKVERRCNELKMLIENAYDEKDYARAKEYTERLSFLQDNPDGEEDFVWRRRQISYKHL